MRALSPPPWNGWPRNPLVLGAAMSLSCGIRAGGGRKAPGRVSCKRWGPGERQSESDNDGRTRHASALPVVV
jgi:hypothetical protein